MNCAENFVSMPFKAYSPPAKDFGMIGDSYSKGNPVSYDGMDPKQLESHLQKINTDVKYPEKVQPIYQGHGYPLKSEEQMDDQDGVSIVPYSNVQSRPECCVGNNYSEMSTSSGCLCGLSYTKNQDNPSKNL